MYQSVFGQLQNINIPRRAERPTIPTCPYIHSAALANTIICSYRTSPLSDRTSTHYVHYNILYYNSYHVIGISYTSVCGPALCLNNVVFGPACEPSPPLRAHKNLASQYRLTIHHTYTHIYVYYATRLRVFVYNIYVCKDVFVCARTAAWTL